MKAAYNKNMCRDEVTEGKERYIETRQALPSGRLLDQSEDYGFWAEYTGRGTIDGVPVIAVYLLDHDQANIEDEGDFDWDTALSNGWIEVDVDEFTDEQVNQLRSGNDLKIE